MAVPQTSAARPSRRPGHRRAQRKSSPRTFRDLMSDVPEFRRLYELFWAELPKQVEWISSDGRHRAPAELTGQMERLLEQRFVRWTPQVDFDASGIARVDEQGHIALRRDANGRIIRDPGEAIMPVREALKRLPRGNPATAWLKLVLQWRGHADHVDPVAHIADIERTTKETVAHGIAVVARRAYRFLEQRGWLAQEVSDTTSVE